MTTTDLPLDPWAHRSEGMRCRTCMWFVPKLPDFVINEQLITACSSSIGRCRRHAPTMNGYPVVMQSDWCGDHKLNERVVAMEQCSQDTGATINPEPHQ